MSFSFTALERCGRTRARLGLLATPHGEVRTPAFMPVGTRGTVKGVTAEQLRTVGTQMVLANAYHLHLRPGEATVRALGGLHRFMNWDGPILTDSGGYQIFSLGHMRALDRDGATFQSVVDGSTIRLTPERVVAIQAELGPDVAMAFDHCPADPTDRTEVLEATERTHHWLERCVREHERLGGVGRGQALFGIVQGGAFEDLRERSVREVTAHDLVGYAIGGVSVGEEKGAHRRAVEVTAPLLPEDRPRYLMGIGTPSDFLHAIASGCDLFDCVTPTRHGRNHQAFTREGRINLRNRKYAHDTSPLDPHDDTGILAGYTKGYVRHLCKTNEMLAGTLLSLHNLRFFHRLLERVRASLAEGSFAELLAEYELGG